MPLNLLFVSEVKQFKKLSLLKIIYDGFIKYVYILYIYKLDVLKVIYRHNLPVYILYVIIYIMKYISFSLPWWLRG